MIKPSNIQRTSSISRKVLFLLLGLLLSLNNFSLQAQGNGKKGKPNKKEKIEELRKKFFNEKLSLTETEQKAFWPLYDEYKKKEKALRDSFKSKYKPNDVVFMDDKQAEAFLNATIKLKEDQTSLYKEYIEKFKKVISVKKVAMLPMLEREFKKEVMQRAKEHGKQGPPPPPPGEDPQDDE
ncbi:MAG: hypothetical protein IT245_07600 [Bacteroidia bacterium]|nr:hypothetical protein [Bacteroidia bacterium]